jgi:hypothetical protein
MGNAEKFDDSIFGGVFILLCIQLVNICLDIHKVRSTSVVSYV